MRIYLVYRHYWPDTVSYSRLLRSIAERLAADGHEVTVFTAQPSYNDIRQEPRPRTEVLGGVRIVRMPLPPERKKILVSRAVNSLLFVGGAVAYGLFEARPQLSMTPSTPPGLMGLAVRLLSQARGTRYLYHCQDLQPEAALLGGKFKKGLLYQLLMQAEKLTHHGADRVVVLSGDMREAVQARGLSGDNIEVLNNFMLELYDEADAVPEALSRRSPEDYRILFAGNHGHYQGLEHVIQAAHLLREHDEIQFQFVGEGLAKAQMIEQAGDLVGKTVHFHPYVSVEVVQRVMEEAELGLVCLQRGLYRLAYPSKTMMLLRAGLPVLAVVEPESELSRFVEDEKIGLTCPGEDPEAMAAAILDGYRRRAQLEPMRARCKEVAERHFGVETNLDRWSELIGLLDPTAAGASPPREA